MVHNQFEMEILVNGKPVQEYSHKGNCYIEGKEGTEFSLRFRNRTSERVLFVPTIDGLSVMDGKSASFKSSGYIVSAYSTETIDGWRTSDHDIARFFFAKIKESYAEQKGEGQNVGVIGCAVFKEKEQIKIIYNTEKEYVPYPVYPRWPWREPYWYGSGAGPSSINLCSTSGGGGGSTFGAASSSAPVQMNASNQVKEDPSGLGTGFGESKYSPVTKVEFERATENPYATFLIYYNTRDNLRVMGVEFKRSQHIAPSAFPTENNDEYCNPPEGWVR